MKIVLTGATGFVGSNFLRLALSRGHHVAGLVIPGETIPPNLSSHPNVSWIRGTLGEAPWEEIAAFRPEVCLHTAWITTPGVYLESPENERFRDDSLGFLRRVNGCGAEHIVALGTCIEYQITQEPLSEERTPIVPSTAYARCKNELRLALEAESATAGFSLCWGRVFYPYGPGEHPSRLCSSIVTRLSRGEIVTLKTPNSVKDYIFIDDLAAAVMTVIENRFSGAINFGTGQGIAVREIATGIGSLLGKPKSIVIADPPDHDPFPYVVADASRLASIGWKPAWPLQRALARICGR